MRVLQFENRRRKLLRDAATANKRRGSAVGRGVLAGAVRSESFSAIGDLSKRKFKDSVESEGTPLTPQTESSRDNRENMAIDILYLPDSGHGSFCTDIEHRDPTIQLVVDNHASILEPESWRTRADGIGALAAAPTPKPMTHTMSLTEFPVDMQSDLHVEEQIVKCTETFFLEYNRIKIFDFQFKFVQNRLFFYRKSLRIRLCSIVTRHVAL